MFMMWTTIAEQPGVCGQGTDMAGSQRQPSRDARAQLTPHRSVAPWISNPFTSDSESLASLRQRLSDPLASTTVCGRQSIADRGPARSISTNMRWRRPTVLAKRRRA